MGLAVNLNTVLATPCACMKAHVPAPVRPSRLHAWECLCATCLVSLLRHLTLLCLLAPPWLTC